MRGRLDEILAREKRRHDRAVLWLIALLGVFGWLMALPVMAADEAVPTSPSAVSTEGLIALAVAVLGTGYQWYARRGNRSATEDLVTTVKETSAEFERQADVYKARATELEGRVDGLESEVESLQSALATATSELKASRRQLEGRAALEQENARLRQSNHEMRQQIRVLETLVVRVAEDEQYLKEAQEEAKRIRAEQGQETAEAIAEVDKRAKKGDA